MDEDSYEDEFADEESNKLLAIDTSNRGSDESYAEMDKYQDDDFNDSESGPGTIVSTNCTGQGDITYHCGNCGSDKRLGSQDPPGCGSCGDHVWNKVNVHDSGVPLSDIQSQNKKKKPSSKSTSAMTSKPPAKTATSSSRATGAVVAEGTSKSPNRSRKPRKLDNIDQQLADLNRRLGEVSAQRRQMAADKLSVPLPPPRPPTKVPATVLGEEASSGGASGGRHLPAMGASDKSSVSVRSSKTKTGHGPAATLHHPKLDYVIADACVSPYLTNPSKKYSEKTLRLPDLIRDLRFQSHNPTASALPMDMARCKSRFQREVVEYRLEYNPKRKKRKGKRKGAGEEIGYPHSQPSRLAPLISTE